MLTLLQQVETSHLVEPGIIGSSIVIGSGVIGRILKNFLDRYLKLQSQINERMDKLIEANSSLIEANKESVKQTQTLVISVNSLINEMKVYNKNTDKINRENA